MKTKAPPSQTALEACQEYHRWASEVERLTAAIAACLCPHESSEEFVEGVGMVGEKVESCFSRAKTEFTGPVDGPRPLNLREVFAKVKDCHECATLCGLIALRRTARRKLGAAKRRIRYVGKAVE